MLSINYLTVSEDMRDFVIQSYSPNRDIDRKQLQWDLVPKMTSRRVDKENNAIEVCLRYEDYDFETVSL